jgi:probable HAF family extracellular repeat protein
MKLHGLTANAMRLGHIVVALAFLAAPMLAQQDSSVQANAPAPAHYTITDLGTLGGSFSLAYGINDNGQIDGFSTLPGDAVQHSFLIEKGTMIDLGTLGGPNSESFANLNNAIQVAGSAETSISDPNGEDFCSFGTHLICLGFVWQNGIMTPLDTLGGSNSQAAAINNQGQVAGYAETGIADPNCPAPQVLQFRPVVWTTGHIAALPLYAADTEGAAFWMNNSHDVVGASGSCAPYDPRYALPLQPRHALLWRNGTPIDLGNLGGEFENSAFAINDRGMIVGASDIPGDMYQHAFSWQNGHMTDLGTLPGDLVSAAVALNTRDQVTGVSDDGSGNIRAFLWQNGTMYDLNTLIAGQSPLYLLHGFGINSSGEIVGFAYNTTVGEVHGFLARPIYSRSQPQGGPLIGKGDGNSSAKFTLPENARRLLLQQLRSIRLGASPSQLVQ